MCDSCDKEQEATNAAVPSSSDVLNSRKRVSFSMICIMVHVLWKNIACFNDIYNVMYLLLEKGHSRSSCTEFGCGGRRVERDGC